MSTAALDLPEDVQALRAYIDAQDRAHRLQLAQRDSQIAGLKEQIQLLLAQRFGASSEKVSSAQLGLFNEAELEGVPEPEPEAVTVPAHERKRGKRKPLPVNVKQVVARSSFLLSAGQSVRFSVSWSKGR